LHAPATEVSAGGSLIRISDPVGPISGPVGRRIRDLAGDRLRELRGELAIRRTLCAKGARPAA